MIIIKLKNGEITPEEVVKNKKHLVKVLREIRLAREMTQVELAEELGVSRFTVQNWERIDSKTVPVGVVAKMLVKWINYNIGAIR